jgi:hypothetical protein
VASQPRPLANQAACAAARASAKSTDIAARAPEQAAGAACRTAVEANRMTFWNTISARLRRAGGA